MRLLVCHNRYRFRSGEDVAFDAALAGWRRAGHDLDVFERDSSDIEKGGAREGFSTALRVVRNPAVESDLAARIHASRPDVAVIQNTLPLLSLSPYDVCVRLGVPVVQILFNYRFLCLNGQLFTGGAICERCANGNYLHGVVRRCYRNSALASAAAARVAWSNRRGGTWLRSVALYVAPDRFLADKLASHGLPRERFRIIPNPIELPEWHGVGSHRGTVLFIGRWTRAKGVMTLLEAATEPAVPHVVLVGGGELEQEVTGHAAVTSGRVSLAGPVYGSELDELIRNAAAVIVPSEWYDNLPMVVCQSFALGRPVVASRINGIPEYVRDGVNGLLVEPGNARGFADAMRDIVSDESRWHDLAQNARETAEHEFAFDQWHEKWETLFAEVRT